jgi:hypothetical protein
MPMDAERAAIDDAVNALRIAVLLAKRIDAEHEALHRAVERTARSLALIAFSCLLTVLEGLELCTV